LKGINLKSETGPGGVIFNRKPGHGISRMKAYRIFLLIIFFTFISRSAVKGQSDFRDGYIITTEHDTVYGQIDYRSVFKNRKLCRFRGENGLNEYTPAQVEGYRFINDRYFSSGIISGTFVEVLVSGKLSLFRDGYDFYIRKEAGSLMRLEAQEIRDTIVDRGVGKVVLKKDLRWKGILSELTSDCRDIYLIISKIDLTEKDLTEFAIEYNLCSGSGFQEFKEKKKWIKIDFGANTGLSASRMNVAGESYLFNYLDDNYFTINPVYGLDLIFTSSRINERIAFQTGLYYSNSSFHSLVVLDKFSSKEYNDSYFKFSSLTIPIMIRYTFPVNAFSLYFNAGADLSVWFKPDSEVSTESVSGNVVEISERQPISFFSHPSGVLGGIGILRSFNHFSIGMDLKYDRSFRLNSVSGFTANTDGIILGIVIMSK